ncbi:MAG: BatA domain-containing protein [Phycisphaeraceae bacterium]|nr:BatA domain-containing protein [Phycisphaeraceae bacterium]
MQFLSPLLLGGLVLAGIPLIIHLLNRRRFQVVDWAPMQYLKLTLRTNRRRLKLEQWLLLLVRMLVIAVLILAVARPMVSAAGLSGMLGGRGRTSRVLVIDDSLSMGYRAEPQSAFTQAIQVAAKYVESVGSQDTLTVRVTSMPQATLARESHKQAFAQLQKNINSLELSDTLSNWGAVFEKIDEDLRTATFPSKEVTIITDLRKKGWDSGVTAFAERWAAEGVALRILDVGSRQTGNVALTELRQEDAIALPGSAVNLRAQVRNDNAAAAPSEQATLTVGSQQRPTMLPELPPAETSVLPLSVRFDKPGNFPITLALPGAGDPLTEDNTRYVASVVREKLDLVLIDGEPGANPFESETDFLSLAFTAANDSWHVEHVTDPAWLTAPRQEAPPDVIVLANVASLTPQQAGALDRLVRAGTGAMIFMGEQVEPLAWNDRLFAGGKGLLPAQLDGVVDEAVTGLVVEPVETSPLELLRRISTASLSRIKARKYMGITVPDKGVEGVRILARWNGPDGRPAVVEKMVGLGRVILLTTTADRQWSDWPIEPTYVLAVRAAALNLTRGSSQQDNVSVGQPLVYAFHGPDRPLEPNIAVPHRDSVQPLLVEPAEGGFVLRYLDTRRAGIYLMSWKDIQGKPHSHLFAVNIDAGESELEPIADGQLAGLMGRLQPQIVHTKGVTAEKAQQSGKEVWRTLATALLALLVIESMLAVWVGRER